MKHYDFTLIICFLKIAVVVAEIFKHSTIVNFL